MRCDIVIPVWNNLEPTKDCVDSIVKNTDIDYRLIIIDNASDEETRIYLESLKGALGAKILLVRNDNNLGFVKAANQGMRLSNAPYICLLNNDTLVTKGWLSEMIKVADSSQDIGLLNPSSNNLGQKPENGEEMERYAERLKKYADSFFEIGSAIGFCMLIKREVMEKIGVFDEIYGMGNFEDTDYSRRAIKEGYVCVRACAAYVYHREGSSFGRGKKFDDDFERNRQIYEFRWGRRKWIAYVIDSYDDNMVKIMERDIMPEVRKGLWVWCFSNKQLDLPSHSNIIANVLDKHFYLKTLWKLLTRKKKFSEIFVTNEKFAIVLERLSFIHKAKVHRY